MVADMANAAGDSISLSILTSGGQTLQNHASVGSPSMNEINTGKWDIVVLQEQSQIPSFTEPEVANYFYPAVKYLDSAIHAANPCSKTLLYMTWGRKNGDDMNCPNWPPVCTYQGMDSLLNKRYLQASHDNGTMVSPVGAVWHYLRQNHPDLELYEADNSHPSFIGSYVAAACFYSSIFQKTAQSFDVKYHLSDSVVQMIKNAVDSVVLLNTQKWNLKVYQLKAEMAYQSVNDTLFFENKSRNALSYTWKFGDGDSSSLPSPKHVYKKGQYQLLFIAHSCGLSDSVKLTIDQRSSNTVQLDQNANLLFPNPSPGAFTLKINKPVESLTVVNTIGQKMNVPITPSSDSELSLEIKGLRPGTYTLIILNKDHSILSYPIVLQELP